MNLSQSFLRMVTRLLLLLILFVCLFLVSTFLYSARYWPDVYNYVNANITIKRIPTISELDLQTIEVDIRFTTEIYSTTDVDNLEISTIDDFDIYDFMKEEMDMKIITKRNIIAEEMKDYRELPSRGIFVDYIFLEEPIEMNSQENNLTNVDDEAKTIITGQIDTEASDIHSTSTDDKKQYNISKITKLVVNKNVDIVHKDTKNRVARLKITAEGYLTGEEFQQDDSNESIIDITTDVNKMYDEVQFKLIDTVDVSNLRTRSPEEVEMVSDSRGGLMQRLLDPICEGNQVCKNFTKTVFPWVVTIFIKDSDSGQFQYTCDGALLSEKVILTSGRCMRQSNKTVDFQNVLVFLGKENLQFMSGNEKVYRIKDVVVHQNFTVDNESAINDLALLILDTAAVLQDNIQKACIHIGDIEGEAGTTSWGPTGQLLPILFEREKSDICNDKDSNIFCATYGLGAALCPSYGGIYATKRSITWCLQGIFYGDPVNRGLCYNKNVLYTSLSNYYTWIYEIIDVNKNIL